MIYLIRSLYRAFLKKWRERNRVASFEPPAQAQDGLAIDAGQEPCDCLPIDVPDCEIVARALYYWRHLDKVGKLRWQAFQPQNGHDDLSIMRTNCMSADLCKEKALELSKEGNEFRGFALIKSGEARTEGFVVRDSRQEYCGHADILINNPYFRPELSAPGEPPDVNFRAKQKELGEKLMRLSIVRTDSAPSEPGWSPSNQWLPIQ